MTETGTLHAGHQATESVTRRPKPPPERRARENLRKRLSATGGRIEAFAADLERVLTDRSGNYHWGSLPGALLCEWHTRQASRDRPGLSQQMARIEKEAAGGCAMSAAWLEHYGPLFALCLDLQREPPPKRAADYDPLEGLTPEQRARIGQLSAPRVKFPAANEWDEWESEGAE